MATTFHGYEIKEKIGSGGMSTVYRGVHATLGYPVAIKVLHPGLAGDDSFIARFEREAKAASALRNNNIALVNDFGSEDDVYFIVMEYIDGPDLQKLFNDFQKHAGRPQAFPAEVALLLLEEVAYGLRAAHTTGIIHRDMKPSNVLINREGEVKIADFGLARDTRNFARLTAQNLTQPGMIVGTPSYMSPEQAAGKDNLDRRTDIFSLGVMAYQLLTGVKPFQGDTPTQVQESIISDPAPPLTEERCPLLTDEITAMVEKMLAKDPNKRYQTIDQVLSAIKECMDSIDRSGALIKYRRDYLSRFAKEPLQFAEELRHQNIKAHLNLGYHYKNLGLENIGDAIREFRYVLSLDPTHPKAGEAVRELEEKAEASGVGKAVRRRREPEEDPAGRTMILPQAGTGSAGRPPGRAAGAAGAAGAGAGAAGKAPPAARADGSRGHGSSRPRLLAVGGFLVIGLAAVGFFALRPRGPEPATVATMPASPPGHAATTAAPAGPAAPGPEEPDGSQTAPGTSAATPAATPAATQPAAQPPAQPVTPPPGPAARPSAATPPPTQVAPPPATPPAPRPAAPREGWVRVVISPHGDVYLDGKLVKEGVKAPVMTVPAGTHNLVLREKGTFGRIELPAFRVAAGETLDLGFHKFQSGTLRVAATPAANVSIDGVDTGRQTPFVLEKIGAGEHTLAVRCPGYAARAAFDVSGGGRPLPSIKGPDGALQFRLQVPPGGEVRVKVELAETP